MKIETKKIDFNKRAKPKVNSLGNIKHVPGGGRVKVRCSKILVFNCLWDKNMIAAYLKGFLKCKEEWRFPFFGISFFSFWRYLRFCIMQLTNVMTSKVVHWNSAILNQEYL